MKKHSLAVQFYITLTGVVLGLFVLIGSFSYLLLSEILPLAESFASTQRDIRVSESKVDYLKKVVEPGVERSTEDLETIKNMFYVPSGEHAYDIILFLEAASKSTGISTKILTPPSDISAIVSIQMSGHFENILKFLRTIENDSRLLRIDALSFSGQGVDMSGSATFELQKP